MNRRGRYTIWKFLLDLLLTVITGGLWALWLIFKACYKILK